MLTPVVARAGGAPDEYGPPAHPRRCRTDEMSSRCKRWPWGNLFIRRRSRDKTVPGRHPLGGVRREHRRKPASGFAIPARGQAGSAALRLPLHPISGNNMPLHQEAVDGSRRISANRLGGSSISESGTSLTETSNRRRGMPCARSRRFPTAWPCVITNSGSARPVVVGLGTVSGVPRGARMIDVVSGRRRDATAPP